MENELHERLAALADKIDATKAQLKARKTWHDGHRLTAGELEARYAYLQQQLDDEISDREAHGHRVSALEQSVRQWVDGLDL